MNKPLEISYKLFEGLEGAGVRHCHWKSNQHLADALAGLTDLDLLVDKRQANLCERILTSLGYKRFIAQPWARYPGIEDWLGFDEQTGKLVHVHLHYQLLSGKKFVKEQHLPWENLLLETAIKDSRYKIFIADPNLEIILLVIRVGLKTSVFRLLGAFLGRGFLPKNILAEFDYLLGQIDEEVAHKYAIDLLKAEYGQKIWAVVCHRSLERSRTIWQIKLAINKALGKQKRYGHVKTFALHLFRSFFFFRSKMQRRLKIFGQTGKRLHSGGAIIAVIGSDGSGKSTISRELRKWLSWKVDIHHTYLGSGDGSIGIRIKLLRFLAALGIGRRATPETARRMGQGHSNREKPRLRELGSGFLGLSIANERYEKMRKANQVRLNGGIVITDRYPQNQFMGIFDGPRINGVNGDNSRAGQFFARRELERYRSVAELAPDLVVKLHVPVEVALSRKPDHNIDNIREKAEITRKLKFTGAKIADINASKPIEEVIKAVKKEVWESL